MADTLLASELFGYTGSWNTSKWPRGVTPSGAQAIARVDSSTSKYGRLYTSAASGGPGAITRRFQYPDSQGRDVELRVDFRFSSSRPGTFRIYLRSSTATISLAYGYYLEINPQTGAINIRNGNTGSGAPIGAFAVGRVYTARFRATGDLIRAKVWPKDVKEPADWQMLINDTRWGKTGAGEVAGGVALLASTPQAATCDILTMRAYTAANPVPDQPVVGAGPNATAQIGNFYARTATAQGTGTLKWAWTMLARPSGSTAALTGGTPTVRVTPDVIGNYTIGVTATDPLGQVSVRQQFTLTAVARSLLGGKLLMDDDGNLVAARHRVCLSTGQWSK